MSRLNRGGTDYRNKHTELEKVIADIDFWKIDEEIAKKIQGMFPFGGSKPNVDAVDIEENSGE